MDTCRVSKYGAGFLPVGNFRKSVISDLAQR
jgi:hypothetical protein